MARWKIPGNPAAGSVGLCDDAPAPTPVARAASRAVVELLEHRQLLASIALIDHTLTLRGDTWAPNTLTVATSGSNLVATANGTRKTFTQAEVHRLSLTGGHRRDLIAVGPDVAERATIVGGDDRDTIYGGAGDDTIHAQGARDVVYGNGGDDVVYGMHNSDTLFGGPGDDDLSGGHGTDRLDQGGSVVNGVPQQSGGTAEIPTPQPVESDNGSTGISLSGGVLTITGATDKPHKITVTLSGSSTLVATLDGTSRSYSASNVSALKINGGHRADVIAIAQAVTDRTTIVGGDGSDTIYGGGGNDTVHAQGAADRVYGNGANDVLYGMSGNDTLYGGPGEDKLSGGDGSDQTESGGTTVAGPTGGGATPGGSVDPAPAPAPDADPDDDGPTDVAPPVPVIVATSSSRIQAGHGFHVHGLASGLKVGNPNTARYHWDFGDPGSDYNTMDGWNVAHLYTDPGTYTVRLTVTNAGFRSASVTTTVTVERSTRRTYYVSNDGSDWNDGSRDNPFRTVQKAASVLGRDDTEVLFRRGDTFDMYKGMHITGDNVVIGAYGDGARPVLRYRGPLTHQAMVSTWDGARDHLIRDLAFDSTYDTWGDDDDGLPRAVVPMGRNTSVVNSEFLHVGYAINTAQVPTALLVKDNLATRSETLRDYFAWVEGTDHVYVGNKVANVRSHVLRIGGGSRINITGNDFTNPPEADGVIRGVLTLHKGEYVYVANNKLRDSKVTIGPLNNESSKDHRWKWAVFEGNEFNTRFIVEHGSEEVMVRNNTFRLDNTYAIVVDGYSSSLDRGVKNLTIVNNTGVNLGEYGNFMKVGSRAEGITLGNNLFLAPNLETWSYTSGGIRIADSTLRSFDRIFNNVWGDPAQRPRAEGGINYLWPDGLASEGYRTPAEWNAFAQVETDYFVDTSYGSGYAPSSSSFAATAAKRFGGVFIDKNGKLRPTSGAWTAGAIEV